MRGQQALYAAVLLAIQASRTAALPAPAESVIGTVTESGSSVAAPSLTLTTAVASATGSGDQTLPSQNPLPPTQAWCPSKIFCAGELLQTIDLANVFSDPKTVVDKPTSGTSKQVLANFDTLLASVNNDTTKLTEEQIVQFVDQNFAGEGLELEGQSLSLYDDTPSFLDKVSDPLVKAFSQKVHSFWPQLIRGTNESTLCQGGDCESSLIPLNHTFVVPGGRFREQYYWDSYWIVQGLILSQLYDVVNGTLQNFMDELETYGFIPNGGRIYYLNRSQPPLFIHMLYDYVKATGDTSILKRALPLAEKELTWWKTNRSLDVTSPYTNKTYSVSRYAVNNTAPRPESYLQDYNIANVDVSLSESEKEDLYAELASGAESGWDYTARFFKEPLAGGTNNTALAQRTLNIRETIPICLNSILYKAHVLLANLYSSSNTSAENSHRSSASNLREAILDLFWDSSKLAFYDFNLTSNSRNSVFSAAHFYPMWNNIFPDEILSNETAAFSVYSSVNMVLNKYNGTFPSTFLQTGQQWDAPNSWPPHNYIVMAALQNLPSNLSSSSVPSAPSGKSTFDLIPSGQLGMSESDLPGQVIAEGKNASVGTDASRLDGTVVNGGNKTSGETWAETLQRELANRYMASALCSWHATGGEIDGLLPKLSDQELNITNSVGNTGNMFEKFSISDVDASGSGGEYTVQAGFGWTNGVALWTAATYGDVLVAPTCPDVKAEASITSGSDSGSDSGSGSSSSGAVTVGMQRKGLVAALIAAVVGSVVVMGV